MAKGKPANMPARSKNAKKAEATREEVAEAVLLAATLRAGGAAAHGTLALKFYEQASS